MHWAGQGSTCVVPCEGAVGTWWLRDGHSVFTNRCTNCTFEAVPGGRIYETRDDHEETVWGTVCGIDAPNFVHFTWHPLR